MYSFVFPYVFQKVCRPDMADRGTLASKRPGFLRMENSILSLSMFIYRDIEVIMSLCIISRISGEHPILSVSTSCLSRSFAIPQDFFPLKSMLPPIAIF